MHSTPNPAWTRRRTLLLPLSVLPLRRAAAAPDALSLLRQTEAVYRAAASFDLSRVTDSRYDVGLSHGTRGRLAAMAPSYFYWESWHTGQRTTPKSKVDKWIICCDGDSVFYYRPSVNEYTEVPYRPRPDGPPRLSEAVILFQRAHEEHFDRFCTLANRPQREPRLRGPKTITVHGRRVTCLQVDTHSLEGSGGRRWTETLWIDPETHHVRQTLRGRYHLTGDRKARVFRWTQDQYEWQALGGEIPLDTFRFHPPEGARRVEVFTSIAPRFGGG